MSHRLLTVLGDGNRSPFELPGIQALYLSDLGVYNDVGLTTPAAPNSAVGGWANLVTPAAPMTQAGVGVNQPILKAGISPTGMPGILFDGANDNLAVANAFGITGDDPNFVLMWAYATTAATTRQYFGGVYGATSYRYGQISSAFKLICSVKDDAAGTTDAPGIPSVSADLNWHVFTIYCYGSGAVTRYSARVDGVKVDTTETAANRGVSTMDHFGVGTFMTSVAVNPFKGYIGGVAVFNQMLAIQDLQAAERWMGAKFGVAVA